MRKGINKLDAVLRMLSEALELDHGIEGQRAVEVFAAVAGEQISAHARAEGVRDDTLMIVTDSPVWSHQLQILEPELVSKLKAALGPECPVKKLRFRSGSMRRAAGVEHSGPDDGHRASARGTEHRRTHRLTRGDWSEIRSAAGAVQDNDLARALKGALRAQVEPEDGPGPKAPPAGTPGQPR